MIPAITCIPHIATAGIRTGERTLDMAVDNVAAVLAGGGPVTPIARA